LACRLSKTSKDLHPAEGTRRKPHFSTLLAFVATDVGLGTNAARALDAPKRKSGLWEMTMTSSRGEGAHTMQQCVDQKADDIASPQAQRQPLAEAQCEKQDVRKDGDKLVIDTVCKHKGTTITTHATVTGSLDSGYRMDSTSTYNPPLRGIKDSFTTVEAKWLGPCKPDQKPGDILMPGMGKFNAQDMMERMQKMPKPQ